MGQVYEAVDRELHQRIAIKAIRPEIAEQPGILARFKREVCAARRITHPNVCRTFDLECHSGASLKQGGDAISITFLTMELLRGETIAERIKRTGPLPATEVRQTALQLASALCAAHDVGVIHCDLKPSNVFMTGDQGYLRVVVTDFGIARIVRSEDRSLLFQTPTLTLGLAAGTPAYMAPEQLELGQCSEASDIYSCGLILFETLTGERLHPLNRFTEKLHSRLKHAGADEEFPWGALLAKCLEPDPAARFPSAQQLLDVLEGRRPFPSTSDLPALRSLRKRRKARRTMGGRRGVR